MAQLRTREEMISLRLNAQELATIKSKALSLGLTPSNFIRLACMTYATQEQVNKPCQLVH